ncbi:MAG: methane monooxygenase/ammonia monooxygenase subunit C [Candidatus Nanopelagicales bacterium]
MTTMDTRPEASTGSSAKKKAPKWGPVARGGSYWSWLIAIAPVAALAIGWRTYQQVFAFKYGLDAHNSDFNKFWLTLALANMTVLPATAGAWYVWMWVSGQKLPKQISREDESRRIWNLWLIILSFTVAVFVGGSYCAEQDASWHQIVTRDTAFTPSHDVLFYGSFPLMIYLATGSYIYARTRLPHLYGGKLMAVPFALIIGGSVLLLFQVAMNEFGHSFFQAEELFAAPLHWPFVIFAYLLAGTFAVWFGTVPRLVELARQERRIAETSETTASVGDVTHA